MQSNRNTIILSMVAISISLLFSFCSKKNITIEKEINQTDFQKAEKYKSLSVFDSATFFYEKASNEFYKDKDYEHWLVSIFGQIDCLLSENDVANALKVTDKLITSIKINSDLNNKFYALALHKQATVYSQSRNFEKASELFKRSIALQKKESVRADTSLALSYNGLGIVNLLQGKTKEAISYFEQSKLMFNESGVKTKRDYAFLLQNLGISNTYLGNYDKAEHFFIDAIEIYKVNVPNGDSQLASMYVNLGRFYQMIRNDKEALNYMDNAESLYSKLNQTNSVNAGQLYLNTAVSYIYTGDYEKVQSYLNKSLDIISSKAAGNIWELQTIYLNMGYVAEKKGNLAKAKELYLQGLTYGNNLPNSVKIIRGLANVSSRLGNRKEAEYYHQLALQVSIQMYGADNPETALSYLRYGDYLSTLGNTTAKSYIDKAISVYSTKFGQKNLEIANAYYYRGLLDLRSGKNPEAINDLQTALRCGFSGFNALDFNQNPSITTENLSITQLNPVIAKADALLRVYRSDTSKSQYLTASAATLKLAVEMIEKLRSSYQDEESKLNISENENNTYRLAIATQAEMFRKTGAHQTLESVFNYAERSKSAVLLAYLREIEAKTSVSIPKELREKEDLIKSQLYFYNKQVYDENLKPKPDKEKIKLWNGKLFDLDKQKLDLVKMIEKRYPQYYEVKYDNSVISLNDVAKKIPDDQALIEYTETDSLLYIFAITSKEQVLSLQPIDGRFKADIDTIRNQLAGSQFINYTKADYDIFCNASKHLFDKLIKPVYGTIKGKDLIIIPDGTLAYLSFDVLLSQLPVNQNFQYQNLAYLIKEFAVSYAPSATTYFKELNHPSRQNNGRVVAFAPDYTKANAVLKEKNESGIPLNNLLNGLKYNVDEVSNIKKDFRVRIFSGPEATEEAFKKYAPDYKVLHLAMHTLINDESPQFSKLVFFKSAGDTLQDGLLNASELINMQLNSDMAILSACNTGNGKFKAGEGVMSIARDFLYAGVPGIVMTLWSVQDKSGVVLMKNFYHYISEGKSRNQALRLAKLDYLKQCDKLTAHPHFWASYVNIGKITPLYLKHSSFMPYIYLILILSLAFGSYIVFRRRR